MHLLVGLSFGRKKTMQVKKKIGTRTSAFGSPGTINHDSTPFYNSKLYEEFRTVEKIEYVENPLSPEFLDKIFNKSSEKMEEQNDNSVHLVVTSPPYNVGKEYDDKAGYHPEERKRRRVSFATVTPSRLCEGSPPFVV